MMGHRRCNRALDAAQRVDRAKRSKRRCLAARERDVMQREAFRFNRIASVGNAGRDVDFETCVSCGARHRQAMRQKIPVFGDNVEQAQRCLLPFGADWATLTSEVGERRSSRADPQQVMDMQDAGRLAAINHEQRCYLCRVENLQRFAGKLIGAHGLGATRHDLVDLRAQ